jgi:hypothetical protein
MKRFRWTLSAVLIPTLAATLIMVGCSGKKPKGGGTSGGGSSGGDSTTPTTGGVSGTAPGDRKPIESAKRGTIKGKVTLAGNKPDTSAADKTLKKAMNDHKNKDVCLAGSPEETSQQKWIINDGGVGNVVVYLKAPKGSYFKLTPEDLKVQDVVIDQPHCAFIPHVVVLFPAYSPDGKTEKSTGQKLLAKNSSTMGHNTKFQGIKTRGDNLTLNPGETKEMTKIRVEDAPIGIGCDIHAFMNAYARTFDHPFATVTKPDGTFELKNVPLDVEVTVAAWHESGAVNEQKITLKDGEDVNLTITPK